jgi:hypothetical protein
MQADGGESFNMSGMNLENLINQSIANRMDLAGIGLAIKLSGKMISTMVSLS